MAIRKPSFNKTQRPSLPSEDEIDKFIERGSPPSPEESETTLKPDVKFQLVVPGDLCEIIDLSRKPSRTSRRAWILQAAEEKLKRDGLL